MAADPLLSRARDVWTTLAGVPVEFPDEGGVSVVASVGSRLCPPGWVGIVELGGAGIATVPGGVLIGPVRDALARARATDVDRLRAALPVVDVLGPAALGYLDEPRFRPATPSADQLPAGHDDLDALLASVPAMDADESGIAEVTSTVSVIRAGRRVVAAAGYRRWPGSVAQLCVLTALDRRCRGLARVVASAAVADALANRLLPQWRAREERSRRVARVLGFRELGAQLSLLLDGEAAFPDPPE